MSCFTQRDNVVLSSVLAVASAGIIATPYTAGLPYGLSPYSTCYLPYAYNGAPIAYNSAPLAVAPAPVPIPAAPVSSQYQAQDEFGNLNYGYVNINSAKQEVGNAYAGVTGSYSYVDANGIPQRVNYIADETLPPFWAYIFKLRKQQTVPSLAKWDGCPEFR
ncbi:hypothetical protein TCAL_16696 [Tigriopus californicus]|uniref:Cuticle protein 6 n=1 Tax=Tigriopus californicus TaxID=6832 RepID=A0A553PM43_TIGCA|nr:hypothetical protein TCAL_16696 [Tigriopus californicus]